MLQLAAIQAKSFTVSLKFCLRDEAFLITTSKNLVHRINQAASQFLELVIANPRSNRPFGSKWVPFEPELFSGKPFPLLQPFESLAISVDNTEGVLHLAHPEFKVRRMPGELPHRQTTRISKRADQRFGDVFDVRHSELGFSGVIGP